MRYGMVIDTNRCIGCFACAMACKAHNNLPNNIWWNRVETVGGDFIDTPRGAYETGDLSMYFTPIACQQCSMPACVEVCPTGASYVREEDGIVAIKQDECIGCNACVTACPYNVRMLYATEPEYYVDFPVGDYDAPQHTSNTMSKCTFCTNRTARNEVPACMDLCPGRARFWGDLDDPTSEASKYLEGKEYMRLLEEAGTEPNTYYII